MGTWITTKTEQEIVLSNTSENRLCFIDKDGESKLIDLMGKWAYYMGVSKIGPEDIMSVTRYVQRSYPELTLEEVDLCIEYSTQNKLDIDTDRFPAFAPNYISIVISAFLKMRNRTMVDVLQRRSEKIRADARTESAKPENQCIGMKELIRQANEEWTAKKEINDLFNVIYNFLRRTKRLLIAKEMEQANAKHTVFVLTQGNIDEALNYGRDIVSKMPPDKGKSIKSILDGDGESTVHRYARNYCVMLYFERVPLDMLLQDIRISEFENIE